MIIAMRFSIKGVGTFSLLGPKNLGISVSLSSSEPSLGSEGVSNVGLLALYVVVVVVVDDVVVGQVGHKGRWVLSGHNGRWVLSGHDGRAVVLVVGLAVVLVVWVVVGVVITVVLSVVLSVVLTVVVSANPKSKVVDGGGLVGAREGTVILGIECWSSSSHSSSLSKSPEPLPSL